MRHDESDRTPTRRVRGIYLIPNLFTIAGLFSGFYAIIAAMKGMFHIAAIAIFIALIFDGLDGRVARMTQSTTEFGAQLDSLCDMACFGVAPALVLYFWSLHTLGKAGWLAAFIYVACTALRLARFNTQINNKMSSRYSQGLTTTMAAGLVAAFVWVGSNYHLPAAHESIAITIGILTVLVAVLKVSGVRYRSFKDLNLKEKVPFIAIIVVAMIFVLIAFDPPDVLLVVFGAYVISGPLMTLWGLLTHHKRKKSRQKKHA